MKLIYPLINLTTGITADEEDASFLASNLEDNYPKKYWKATSVDAQITVPMQAETDCLSVFNTNATSAVVKIYNNAMVLQQTQNLTITENRFYIDYTYQTNTSTITIDLTASTTVYAGVIKAGKSYSVNSPKSGLSETVTDLSTVFELENSSIYTSDDVDSIETLREFKCDIIDTETKVDILRAAAKKFGRNPIAFNLTDTSPAYKNAIFGTLSKELMSINYLGASLCSCNFVIREAV